MKLWRVRRCCGCFRIFMHGGWRFNLPVICREVIRGRKLICVKNVEHIRKFRIFAAQTIRNKAIMADINIRLSADRVKAKAGDMVRIVATFDKPAYASVNERRETVSYPNLIRTSEKVQGVDIMAEVHWDTTDFIIMTDSSRVPHLNENENTVAAWYHVEVTDEPQDIGAFQYSVGLLSDLHICKANNKDKNSNWWDEDDFRRAMYLLAADKNVKFVASCGDIAEAYTNDDRKHPEATCDADYAEFIEIYDVPYWQVAGLRFFSPLGNHDFKGLYESRYGDDIQGKKNSETSFGYNATVCKRISSIWPNGQHVNSIPDNGRSRIIFDLEKGKDKASGQSDMNFFAYNAYVDLYAKQAGYTGASIWDKSKGGISDEAIRLTKQYVNANWEACKDNLSGFADTGIHGRNAYSKLSYYLKKDNNIYVFLSVDYGDDVWGVNDKWHDRMIHARTIINLNTDDPYIKRMMEYVSDTGYTEADELYNYQYYSPNALVWLKELLEANTDKKVYIFTHHFMPNRVGNGAGLPKDGNWQYADIHPSSEKDAKEGGIYCVGSNALTGIQFWFFTKLLNTYKNVIMFSGHSHISMASGVNFDNHDYDIFRPSVGGKYVYSKSNENPKCESAWCVSLPSASKPRDIVDGQSVRRYEDAEMTVMEVYEKGVKIKGYKVRRDNKDVQELTAERTIKLL